MAERVSREPKHLIHWVPLQRSRERPVGDRDTTPRRVWATRRARLGVEPRQLIRIVSGRSETDAERVRSHELRRQGGVVVVVLGKSFAERPGGLRTPSLRPEEATDAQRRNGTVSRLPGHAERLPEARDRLRERQQGLGAAERSISVARCPWSGGSDSARRR